LTTDRSKAPALARCWRTNGGRLSTSLAAPSQQLVSYTRKHAASRFHGSQRAGWEPYQDCEWDLFQPPRQSVHTGIAAASTCPSTPARCWYIPEAGANSRAIGVGGPVQATKKIKNKENKKINQGPPSPNERCECGVRKPKPSVGIRNGRPRPPAPLQNPPRQPIAGTGNEGHVEIEQFPCRGALHDASTSTLTREREKK
jgi:hypothetical protein